MPLERRHLVASLFAAALVVAAAPRVVHRLDPARVSEQGFVRAGIAARTDAPALAARPYDRDLRATCTGSGPTPRGREAFGRWPYLQQVGPDGAELMWTVRPELADSALELVVVDAGRHEIARSRPERDDEVESPSGPLFHARIAGLEPDRIYCYRIESEGEAWTEPTGFRTAPRPGEGIVRMVGLADLGMDTPDQRAVRDAFMQHGAELVLFAGDLSYDEGTREQFDAHFFAVYRDYLMHVPAYPAAGNHEYHTEDALPFREAFSLADHGVEPGRERWYSFDWGPAHVVVLDSELLVDEQREWLADDLRAEGGAQPHVIAVVHRPPYASGYHGSDLEVRELFADLFVEHQVGLVLSGHEHHYERSKRIDGVTYVVSGGGGAGTRRTGKEEHAEVAVRVAHFVHLTADPDALSVVAVDAEGTPFDRVEIPARGR